MYYIACAWYKGQRLRLDILTQEVIALEKPLIQAATVTTDNQLLKSVDCPDCSDNLLKFYDWDKMKYLCENCGLTINNPHS
jgi:ribosomal protein S27E